MKQFLLIFLLMCCFGAVFGADFSRIDKQSETVPTRLKTAPEIAAYLTRNLTSPTEKVRAIYIWIAHNIRYDVEKMKLNETYNNPQELVDYALASRAGVCANYTALFNACCFSVGVQSYVVEGYVRQNGKIILIGHSWNAVKIDNRFYEIDVTWAAGYVDNNKFTQKFEDKYFMVLPVEFIKTHMPIDPVWQFSFNPITYKDFETSNFQGFLKKAKFNFSDSIKAFSTFNKLDELEHKRLRIMKCGIPNNIVKDELKNVSEQIEIEKHNIQNVKYNEAVTKYNKGVNEYNNYVMLRKKETVNDKKNIDEMLKVLNLAQKTTIEASNLVSVIKTTDLKMTNQIRDFKKNTDQLVSKINYEIDYVRTLK
jgi:hypothetical protein